MDNLAFLFAANVFVWGGIFYYLFRIKKHQKYLQSDLDLIKASLKKESKSE